jgi:hypothetical protein
LQVALIENKTEAAKALIDADMSTFKKLISDRAIDLLPQLLELGYDVNREVDKGSPLLHYVLENIDDGPAEKLLEIILNPERGKILEDINQLDGRQRTALQLAQIRLQLMRLLLSYGADLECCTMPKYEWFLMYRIHTMPPEDTMPGLLLKRWEHGGIEFEFKDLNKMKLFPCCPRTIGIHSEASILCVVGLYSTLQL